MSDLLVSAFTPRLGSGQGLRTYGIVRALAAAGPVELLYADFGAEEPAPEYHSMPGLTLHRVSPSRGARRAFAYARSRMAGAPDGFARGASPELAAAASELAASPGRGRIVADGPVVATALLGLAGKRPLTYNAHNLESAFRTRIEGGGPAAERRLRRFEGKLLRGYAESWMASPADVRMARELEPAAAIVYVPNVVDVAAIEPRSLPAGSGRVLFVGDFTYPPNREGFAYLAERVLPELWGRVPEARLEVVGRGLEPDPRSDPRIEVRGFVDDLAAAYAGADCVAVPLLSGGGSPLKFIEALAYGLPVVATPVAAAGLEIEAGRHYLRAEDPASFAAALERALRGDASEPALEGRRLAQREYSIEALAGRLST